MESQQTLFGLKSSFGLPPSKNTVLLLSKTGYLQLDTVLQEALGAAEQFNNIHLPFQEVSQLNWLASQSDFTIQKHISLR